MFRTTQCPYKIMLVDDHEVVRVGVASCLESEPDIHLVGSHATSSALLHSLHEIKTDVALIDFRLGPQDIDGIALIKVLRDKFPAVRVLVLSAYAQTSLIADALRVGAHGYLAKSQPISELPTAIRTIGNRQIYLDKAIKAQMSVQFDTSRPSSLAPLQRAARGAMNRLSLREREIIRCVLDGMSLKQIASKFCRSPNTISSQKSSAYRKLCIQHDSELFKVQDELQL